MSFEIPEWLSNIEIFNDEIDGYIKSGYDVLSYDFTVLLMGDREINNMVHHVVYQKNLGKVKKIDISLSLVSNLQVFYTKSNFIYRKELLTFQEEDREVVRAEFLSGVMKILEGSGPDLYNRIFYLVNDRDKYQCLEYVPHLYNRIFDDMGHGVDHVYKDGHDYARISRGVIFLNNLEKAEVVKRNERETSGNLGR